jgi:hypothetical protein
MGAVNIHPAAEYIRLGVRDVFPGWKIGIEGLHRDHTFPAAKKAVGRETSLIVTSISAIFVNGRETTFFAVFTTSFAGLADVPPHSVLLPEQFTDVLQK